MISHVSIQFINDVIDYEDVTEYYSAIFLLLFDHKTLQLGVPYFGDDRRANRKPRPHVSLRLWFYFQ